MRKKNLKELMDEGVLTAGEELRMNYADLEFIGIVTEEGKIKTEIGIASVSQSAADMIKFSGRSKRKQMVANGYYWWKNKMRISLNDLRGEEGEKKIRRAGLKDLKKMVEEDILKEKEEIYLSYRGEEYRGRVTKEGKIETCLGNFNIGQATLKMMHLNEKCESSLESVNGYYCWKTWNGTRLTKLRK
jgi:hemin uptake protein HemP